MPKEKEENKDKLLCVENLRHTEYYGLQEEFDKLYENSKNGAEFTNLMPLILSRENILLAYRNIKTNTGSKTAGTDKLTINDIGKLQADKVVEKVRYIVEGSMHGYRPKAVRRKDIPKPYDLTKTRPLGIPCIWDRLIQQCIKQVMEPICEAKFSENSYGFRPNRSVEHAIERTYRYLQRSHMHYVIEFDIKGFFDNVNHSKLIKQIWAMGIHDKHLIYVLRKILTAPVKMPNGEMVYPNKGTPQGGIISPLLANIVLNELDHWIESQWQNSNIMQNYKIISPNSTKENRSGVYNAMRKTKLKEMYIVRYADDFRIFCRTKTEAEKTKIAIIQWLEERLKLEISQEKTRIVNVKRRYSEFLGFKIKVVAKGKKYVVNSRISNKQLKNKSQKLVEQIKRIAKPEGNRTEYDEVALYNSMVMGIHNYYKIATGISVDCNYLHRRVMTVMTSRLKKKRSNRLVKNGRPLTVVEKKMYGKSKMIRYLAGPDEPIYPIGYVKHRNPMAKKRSICPYTKEGRIGLHNNLRINMTLLYALMRQPLNNRSIQYTDNRISLFSAQWGKCAITGKSFQTLNEIHCHHKTPRKQKGGDDYSNLVLILEPIHILIHAKAYETIEKYKSIFDLDKQQIAKVNELRKMAELPPIN